MQYPLEGIFAVMEKRLFAALILTITFGLVMAQKNSAPVFPGSFIGNWKGKLQWMVAGKPMQILNYKAMYTFLLIIVAFKSDGT